MYIFIIIVYQKMILLEKIHSILQNVGVIH
jgi:hypothetical protein